MLAGPFSIESFSFFKMQIKTIKKKLSVSFWWIIMILFFLFVWSRVINDDSLSQLVLCSGQDFCLFVFFVFVLDGMIREDYFNFFNDFLCLTRCSSTTWMRDYQGIFGLFTGGWKRAFLPLTFLIMNSHGTRAWLSKNVDMPRPFSAENL